MDVNIYPGVMSFLCAESLEGKSFYASLKSHELLSDEGALIELKTYILDRSDVICGVLEAIYSWVSEDYNIWEISKILREHQLEGIDVDYALKKKAFHMVNVDGDLSAVEKSLYDLVVDKRDRHGLAQEVAYVTFSAILATCNDAFDWLENHMSQIHPEPR